MTSQETTIRILIITDQAADVARVRAMLGENQETRYEVESAATYEEGIARLRRNEHDACLLDGRDEGAAGGVALLQIVARHGCRVPVIMLTGPEDRDARREALSAGAVDTLDEDEINASLLARAIRYATERRKVEDALRGAQTRLVEAEMRKDELLAMLAHELRNPLAPIRYALQALQMDAPKHANFLRLRELIDRQVRQMARLLDDVLDVARMARGRVHLKKEKVDLGSIVDQAVEAARPMMQERRLELVYTRRPEPLWLEGEAPRLEQIVRNLLHNAIRFSNAGGQIWLNVEPEVDGTQAVVRLVDTGVGISPELLPRIFDLFTQTDHSLNHAQGGLGIGLTMVKHLVQMHGGMVRARSEGLGKGSEFEVRLPLLEHPEMKIPKPEPERWETISRVDGPVIPGEGRRVLVVEDNLDSASSLAELIERWGYETRVVNDGLAAIEAATSFRPDVVLLDIGLPGMNGYQVARLMRSRPALKNAVLVALTGYGQEEDRRCAEQAGFDRHFTKPVEPGALHALLHRAA